MHRTVNFQKVEVKSNNLLLSNKRSSPAISYDGTTPHRFNPTQYIPAMNEMLAVMRKWNDLWSHHDQQEYLEDIEMILTCGFCDYKNTFGSDDREEFSEKFLRLTFSERKGIHGLAEKSYQNQGIVDIKDVAGFYEKPPTQPYFVCLSRGLRGYQDGSQRFPFSTLDAAQKALTAAQGQHDKVERVDVVMMACSPACIFTGYHQTHSALKLALHQRASEENARGSMKSSHFNVQLCTECCAVAPQSQPSDRRN
jgi:hypothetical protein